MYLICVADGEDLNCVADGEALQQRGERRKGREAAALFEQAAAKFQQALAVSGQGAQLPPPARLADCRFALAETLQTWAQALQADCASLPDSELTPAREAEVNRRAGHLYEQAVQAYRQVPDAGTPGSMRADAAVNCGNTLAAWAEVCAGLPEAAPDGSAASALLQQAEACYSAALAKEEDAAVRDFVLDPGISYFICITCFHPLCLRAPFPLCTQTWSNLGDVLIQHGELLSDCGGGGDPSALFSHAIVAYDKSCGLSSTDLGDDLPGLLTNWGAGLLAASAHAHDPVVALTMLQEAAQRLRQATGFDRGDAAPHNALGEVLAAAAERTLQAGSTSVSVPGLLQAALDEGFHAAAHINCRNVDALVGTAETRVQMARVALAAGNPTAATNHYHRALESYQAALAQPQALGSFSERCNVRYNAACCLVGAGRLEEAVAMITALIAVGGVGREEALEDPDLAPIHPRL